MLYLHKCGSTIREESGSDLSAFTFRFDFTYSLTKRKELISMSGGKRNKKSYVESICVSVDCVLQSAALESGVSFFL